MRAPFLATLPAVLLTLVSHAWAPGLDTWTFVAGRPGEGLVEAAGHRPVGGESIVLPHRVLLPNRALWYTRTIDLPPDAVLRVVADDGAQVFVDGERLAHHRQWFFTRKGQHGRREVVVRVLNNAMAGGLRQVDVATRHDVLVAAGPASPDLRGFDPVESKAFRSRMPAAGMPCRFVLWADSQGGWATFGRLVATMVEHQPHVAAGVGDLVADGSDPDAWFAFVRTLSPLARRASVVPIVGNHDYDGFYNALRSTWYERWFRPVDPSTWFAWSCGAVRFVALDLNREFPIGISPGSPQARWLAREVASPAWAGARWRVVLVHQPPWSRSWEGYDGDAAVRVIVERLARERLDVVVSGHSHAYERFSRELEGRTVLQLITGGAGGSLEAPGPAHDQPDARLVLRHHVVRGVAAATGLRFEAVDTDGVVFDEVRIPQ